MADIAEEHARRFVAVAGHPIYPMLLPIPIVCFVAALVADVAYALTETLMWLNFSNWLLPAGLLFGLVSLVFLLIDFIRLPGMHRIAGWAHLLLFVAAWLAQLVNMFVHNRDGWTAVVPLGMTLSGMSVVLILVAGWLYRPATAEVMR